jgi:very-short-patch-repair endonuclease
VRSSVVHKDVVIHSGEWPRWRRLRSLATLGGMSDRMWTFEDAVGRSSRKVLRWQVERGELIRPTRGVYAEGSLDDDGRLRALFLRLPPEAVLTRWSAAHRLGFEPTPPAKLQIVLPPGVTRPKVPGLTVFEAVLPLPEPVPVGGIPCVPPVRCAIDLARTSRRLDALPVLDGVLRSGLVTHEDLVVEADRHHGLRGIRQARALVGLADGRSECRQESQLRLVLIDGKLPRPEPQLWVHDRSGVPRFRLDLGYEEPKVGIEYDGVSHIDRERLRYDRDRGNWLDAQGWTMRYFTDRDLYSRPQYIVDSVRAALGRRPSPAIL